jgi:nicotinamidase/pyrazinamidase
VELGDISFAAPVKAETSDALVVVDMQNDFMPGGALPVAGGDLFIKGVNGLMRRFFTSGLTVALTQDWHPSGHHSFASAHENKKPFDAFSAPGLGPVLWPDHCVQGSPGAEFHAALETSFAHAVIRKGFHSAVDSYSGFLENDRATETGLDGYLKGRGVRRLFVCGLALDYCVYFTAMDGIDKGYEVYFIADLTKPVASPENSVSDALQGMTRKGVRFLRAVSVLV